MHSALQAEVRLTQKFVGSSCRYCARRSESPRRFFHHTRDLRAVRGPRDDAGSHPPPSSEKDKDSEGKPQVPVRATPASFALPPTVAQHFFNQDGPPDDPEQPSVNTFYGSTANRKLRARAKKELPEPTAVAPDWYRDNNITLWGEGVPSTLEDHTETPATNPAEGSQQDTPSPEGSSPGPLEYLACLAPPDAADASIKKGTTQYKAFGATEEARQEAKFDLRPSRYYIDALQDAEIMHTLRGLLKPLVQKEFHDEPASKTVHLLLHYAAQDGELLLDEYVRCAAQRLQSDLITLDAQDISELISVAQKGPDVTKDARMLSYEVSRPRLKDNLQLDDSAESGLEHEDAEDDDEVDSLESPRGRDALGMPIVVGKPFTINLEQLFGPQRGPGSRRNASGPASKFFTDLTQMASPQSRSDTEPFSGLVESLLSSIQSRRVKQANSSANVLLRDQPEPQGTAQDSAIIHIKDIGAIQENKIGGQFVQELFSQVEKRRANGENVTVVGTECEQLDPLDDGRSEVESLQRTKDSDMSRAIVITPCFPKPTMRMDLFKDQRRRRVAINLRHLWEMMRLKDKNDFLGFKPGFWKDDLHDKIGKADWQLLSGEILSFSHVHRLCTFLHGIHSASLTGLMEATSADTGPGLLSQVDSILKGSDDTKMKWVDKQQARDRDLMLNVPRRKPVEDSRLTKIRAAATKHEKKLMSGIIEADKISTTFDEVHAPPATVDALQTLTMLSITRADAFTYGVLKTDKIPGLLMYGPPGTGKTLLAKAVAKESGATMLEVSAAEINDMYVGEGEKNVKALFSLAKKLSPCVVFLDEADALFSARSASGRRVSHRELLNQFLKEWDGMSNDSGSAFIMVATNRPMDLDDAVLRRLPRRLLVDLPAEPDRLEILKIHLRNEQLADDISLPTLAKNTPFYSGSDLKNLAVTAALNAVREETEASKKHTGDEPYQFPEKRILRSEHFDRALDEISASISEDMSSLKDIKKFDEQYGDKRGKKRAKKWGFKTAEEGGDTVKVRN